MKPQFITFTGADDWTDIDGMIQLSEHYPIEWGILFSPERQGDEPRYPSLDTLARLSRANLRLSAHLCGLHGRNVNGDTRDTFTAPFKSGQFSRMQINHAKPNPLRIAQVAKSWGIRAIAQCRGYDFPRDTRVDWLFDISGGRGLRPTVWPLNNSSKLVGYAGGINPDNVLDILMQIGPSAPFWIDMESGVRTNDRFDLAKCKAVCEAVCGEGK